MSVKLASIYCFLDQLNAHFAENNLTKKLCKKYWWRNILYVSNVIVSEKLLDKKSLIIITLLSYNDVIMGS